MRLLFDDLIGAAEDRGSDLDADLSRRLEVEGQLELGGLLNRRVGGRRSPEHFVYLRSLHRLELAVRRAIARQTPESGHFTPFAYRRKLVREEQPAELFTNPENSGEDRMLTPSTPPSRRLSKAGEISVGLCTSTV
jgi:hypothetical protein